jgi:hypothetical protein
MPPRIQDHPPQRILTAKDLQQRGENWFLPFGVNGRQTSLPVTRVPSSNGESPTWIAWFEPRHQEVREIGSSLMTPYIVLLDPGITIQSWSSKSMEMIGDAVDTASQEINREIPLITLLGGEDESKIQDALLRESVPKDELHLWYKDYSPITGKHKFVGILPSMVPQLIAALKTGKNICILDDVYSSGATVETIRQLLSEVLGREGITIAPRDIPVVTAALEVFGEYDDTQRQAKNVWSAVVIPVLSGDLTVPSQR